jgi:cytidine deaminase
LLIIQIVIIAIERASGIVKPRRRGSYVTAHIGCALVTEKGNIYLGVDIETPCSMGFCAEHTAIGAMVTAGESQIQKVVAVYLEPDNTLRVLPPCGRCREFIHQVDERNLQTIVILSEDKEVTLSELLPYRWQLVWEQSKA